MKSILFINVKMPTVVGSLTFISRKDATLEGLKARKIFIFHYFSVYEHDKSFYNLRVRGNLGDHIFPPRKDETK